jgi:hypothetical protein
MPIVIAAVLAAAGIGAAALARPRLTPLRYFPETNHLLSDPFLGYFDQHGGLETFGYPLTETYDLADGTLVQTFQHAQLALTVRGVELSPLGHLLRLGDGQTTDRVAAEFADTYHRLGGEAFFGPALGEVHLENGTLIQDFERARLAKDAFGDVRLADLGRVYLAAFPPPEMGQAAFGLRGTPMPPPAVRANVSVEQPTIGQGGRQTIYLLTEDAQGKPIPAAQSLAVLHYGSATAEVELPPTGANGLASATFIAPPAQPGSKVIVQMNVLVGDIFISVETTYFQWW